MGEKKGEGFVPHPCILANLIIGDVCRVQDHVGGVQTQIDLGVKWSPVHHCADHAFVRDLNANVALVEVAHDVLEIGRHGGIVDLESDDGADLAEAARALEEALASHSQFSELGWMGVGDLSDDGRVRFVAEAAP